VLTVTGPLVWTEVIGFAKPLQPFKFSTAITLPFTVLMVWLFSVTDRSPAADAERRAFASQTLLAHGH